MKTTVHSMGKNKQDPQKHAEKISKVLLVMPLLIVGGIVGTMAYDRAFLPEQKAQAQVTQEVQFEWFKWHTFGRESEKNKVEFVIKNGPDAGENALAYYYVRSSGKDLKKGDIVNVTYKTRRLSDQNMIMEVKKPKVR